jgi:hypothetical protein
VEQVFNVREMSPYPATTDSVFWLKRPWRHFGLTQINSEVPIPFKKLC